MYHGANRATDKFYLLIARIARPKKKTSFLKLPTKTKNLFFLSYGLRDQKKNYRLLIIALDLRLLVYLFNFFSLIYVYF